MVPSPNVLPEDKQKITDLLKKPWNPYLRRHSALTEKARILKEPILKMHAGWSQRSQMHLKYEHRHCSVEWDPESENLRKESKLEVPDRNIEPAATSTGYNMADEVEIHHTPEIRGGFAELQKKGLKIKDYHTTEKE